MKTLAPILALALALALVPGTASADADLAIELEAMGEQHDVQIINHGDASVSVLVDGELVTTQGILP